MGRLSLGQAGLWKPVSAEYYAFDLPTSLLGSVPEELDDDQGGVNGRAASALADWAVATLDPATSTEHWSAPSEDQVRGWLPSHTLAIQQGTLVRQIVPVCQAGRLALRCVLVPEVSAALSNPRRMRIEKTLAAAQNQWRMTRLGFGGTAGKPTIEAEIDLTACPLGLASHLTRAGRTALEMVSRHQLPTLDALCDPTVHCATWESPV